MDFEKMSQQEKAVAVAKDILLQMNKKVYKPTAGSYLTDIEISHDTDKDTSIKENFDKIQSCTVCAIGSMLLSVTHLGNKLNFNELFRGGTVTIYDLDNPKIGELLSLLFDDKTLFLIEECFEGGYDYNNNNDFGDNPDRYSINVKGFNVGELTSDEIEKCNSFNMMYGDKPNVALREICDNIIRNNGLFIL